MTDKTTLGENTRSPIDGSEWVRLATPGANWKAQLAAIMTALGGSLPRPAQGTFPIGLGNKYVSFPGALDNAFLARQVNIKLLPTPGAARNWAEIDGLPDASFLVAIDAGTNDW